jgi:hypothetical protein
VIIHREAHEMGQAGILPQGESSQKRLMPCLQIRIEIDG